MSAKNIAFSVTFKTYDGKDIPVKHKVFESVETAKQYAVENISTGNYKSYVINENDEPELPLSGGGGPTAKQAKSDSEREGRQSIYQKKHAAAKAAAEKRHPVGSSVSFDPAYAHALGAGVDRHPGLKALSKPGKRTFTGTVADHVNQISNYKGNGIMSVGGDDPRYYPLVKLDKPVKVAGRVISYTTINPPYLNISEDINEISSEKIKDYLRANTKQTAELRRGPRGYGLNVPFADTLKANKRDVEFKKAAKRLKKKEMSEAANAEMDNFTNDDIQELISLPLDRAKARAIELISTKSSRPMKPEKVNWFKKAIAKKRSTMDVIKLMYDLLLSGEGNSVLGTSSSMKKNSYRRTFGENEEQVNEDISIDAMDMEKDHEVQMARGQLYHAARDAMRLHKMLKSVSEAQGLEGWVAAKITKAADYLNSVADYMEYELVGGAIDNVIPDEVAMETAPINEAMKLSKDQIILPEPGAEKFAKHYRAGMMGDHRNGGPTEQDQINSEKFWKLYDSNRLRSGFAGSGTVRYTNKNTGESFIVDISPNGKGFHGSNHSISVDSQVNETAYDKDLDDNKPIVVSGVKGAKSKPFRKKFRNMAAYEKWSDTDVADDYEVHNVINETAYEKDLDDNKPIVVRGVKGAKSKPFRKKFRNMAAYEKWSDTDAASDYEVHDVMNETTTAGGVATVAQPMGKMRKRKK